MITNYLKISLRALQRHPSYAGINIAGLAVGMACFMLIALYVQDERQFDSFQYQNLTFGETEVFFVEASVFDIFTFPLIQGNEKTVLLNPNTVVLTETTAKRYFGDENPLGKVIVMSDTLNFTVTGVASDIPAQSHLNFDILLSFSTYKSLQAARGRDLDNLWSSGTFYTYALLTSPDALDSARGQLSAYLERQIGVQSARHGVQPGSSAPERHSSALESASRTRS